MRAVVIVLNVLACIPLGLLFLTLISNKEYAEVVVEGPVFFGDFFLLVAVAPAPACLLALALRDFRDLRWFIVWMVAASASGVLCYYTAPSVRRERLMEELVEVNMALDSLRSQGPEFAGGSEYFKHRTSELTMFQRRFRDQIDFLRSSEKVADPRRTRVTWFFGGVAALALLNAITSWFARHRRD